MCNGVYYYKRSLNICGYIGDLYIYLYILLQLYNINIRFIYSYELF